MESCDLLEICLDAPLGAKALGTADQLLRSSVKNALAAEAADAADRHGWKASLGSYVLVVRRFVRDRRGRGTDDSSARTEIAALFDGGILTRRLATAVHVATYYAPAEAERLVVTVARAGSEAALRTRYRLPSSALRTV